MGENRTPSTVFWLICGAITILVGIYLLVPLMGWQHEPGLPKANAEIRTLGVAVAQFKAEYDFYPILLATAEDCRASNSDFTFGVPLSNGLTNSAPDNSEVMNILLAQETVPRAEIRSTRKIRFMDLKISQSTNDPGLGPDGVYRDPWGNPFIITLDLSGDGYCEDALYSRPAVSSKTVGQTGSLNFESSGTNPNIIRLKTEVMIWSMGRDGKADPNISANEGVNADNILSWE